MDVGAPGGGLMNTSPGAVISNGSIGVFPQGNDTAMWEKFELTP